MSITSFDHFIETLDSVPSELERNFNTMADLDGRVGDMLKRIHSCVKDYRKSNKKDERLSLYKESMDLFDKARAYADDKIEIAMQTYNLVDKHIRRLESLPHTTNQEADGTPGPLDKDQKRSLSGDGTAPGSDTIEPLAVDMPLDPNEPKYCFCDQVSYGNMIACDNEECPIEWFHFPCVDLKSKPKGKWYCPECFNINKKVKHRTKRHKT